MPAQRKMELQAAYPSQAEGGFAGDISKSLRLALNAWDKKRNSAGFKYGRSQGTFRCEKTAAEREEISWNAAPEIKRKSRKAQKRAQMTADQLAERRAYMRQHRATESPEARAERLKVRRAAYLLKKGGVIQKRRGMTHDEKKAARKEQKRRYLERKRAGIVGLTPRKQSPLTPEQLKRKSERERGYYAARKQKHQTVSAS